MTKYLVLQTDKYNLNQSGYSQFYSGEDMLTALREWIKAEWEYEDEEEVMGWLDEQIRYGNVKVNEDLLTYEGEESDIFLIKL